MNIVTYPDGSIVKGLVFCCEELSDFCLEGKGLTLREHKGVLLEPTMKVSGDDAFTIIRVWYCPFCGAKVIKEIWEGDKDAGV